jgi:hypothetical protein
MEHNAVSIRPFVGAKDFEVSRNFYLDLGFEEIILDPKMSLFKTGQLGFYLQDAYVQDWVDNTMIFMEVDNAQTYFERMAALNLTDKYSTVKLIPLRVENWGRECFLIDPSGILWHFGEFFTK